MVAAEAAQPPPEAAARLVAALAVARQRWPLLCTGVFLYRVLELCAGALLPAGICWIVDPSAMLPIFVLLWYLPAAGRAGSATRPVTFPLLAFAVGDVSLLGLRPVPRAARGMYVICVFRTLVLAALIPLCIRWSPLPDDLKHMVVNRKALELFDETLREDGASDVHVTLWIFSGAAVLAGSLLWVLLTVPLLCGSAFAYREKPCQPACLYEIQELAVCVEQASQTESPERCRAALAQLRRHHPGLVLTSVFNTAGPAWAVLLHFVADAVSVGTLAISGRWTLALPLALSLANSAGYLRRRMPTGPHRLPLEVVLSLRRGLATSEYMEAIRGDKAVLRVPETVLKVYALPLAAKTTISTLCGLGAIFGNVLLVAKFMLCELDLDIQSVCEGHDQSTWEAKKRRLMWKWTWK